MSHAWVEIDRDQLRSNITAIKNEMPPRLQWISVVKDQAYGHGADLVAREALQAGASGLAVATVDEALSMRKTFGKASILIFGERNLEEMEVCARSDIQFFVNDPGAAENAGTLAKQLNRKLSVTCKINTGLNRYGIRWDEAASTIRRIFSFPGIEVASMMTHFAMSDETDKSFAWEQLSRFQQVIQSLREDHTISPSVLLHACNSGGYLDLPEAHLDLVRLGILPLGVFPSKVCRRVSGVKPVMSVKSKVALIRNIEANDVVGYGMRYKATAKTKIVVIPIGYSSGYPRLRNKGAVIIRGQLAPIVGGVSMNAITADVTHISGATSQDEVVLLGTQGTAQISADDLAGWADTVSYDILTRFGIGGARHIFATLRAS